MELQDRDIRLLEELEKWGTLGLGQASGLLFKREEDTGKRLRLFFGKLERRDYWTAAYKRLTILEKAGLIRRGHYPGWAVDGPVYFLTYAGHSCLREHRQNGFLDHQRSLGVRKVYQHGWAVGAGLALSEVFGWKVKSKRELAQTDWFTRRKEKLYRPLLPDLWIDTGTHAAVLYTVPEKSRFWRRYVRSWHLFHLQFGYVRQLHLGSWTRFPQELAALARKHGFWHVGAATARDFERDLGRCRFEYSAPDKEFYLQQEQSQAVAPMAVAA